MELATAPCLGQHVIKSAYLPVPGRDQTNPFVEASFGQRQLFVLAILANIHSLHLVIKESADLFQIIILEPSSSKWNSSLMLSSISHFIAPWGHGLEGSKFERTASCTLIEQFENFISTDSLSVSDQLELLDLPFVELLGADLNRVTVYDDGMFHIAALALVFA